MDEQETQGAGNVEAKAASMGWVPKDRFRGDPEKWADAQTFVDRGEHFLPILRENNRRLQEEHGRTQAEVQRLSTLLENSQSSIKELLKFHEEDTRTKVEAQKTRLLAELKRAKTDDDIDAEVEITDQLTKVNAALKVEPKVEEKPAEKTAPQIDPSFTAWQAQPENSWFGKDRRKTHFALSVAQDLRDSGDRTLGVAFYNKVTAEVEAAFGAADKPVDKVSGSRGGGGNGGGGGQSYKDLPSEAKAACDKQAQSLVGEGRAFKDQAAWRSYYAELFFKD